MTTQTLSRRTSTPRTSSRLAGQTLALASILAIAGFTVLGSSSSTRRSSRSRPRRSSTCSASTRELLSPGSSSWS